MPATTPRLRALSTGPATGPVAPPWRLLTALLLAWLLALAAGCASTPLPPPQLYRLDPAPPEPVAASPGPPAGAAAQVWQLVGPVGVPGYLDRDALLVPQGQAGLQALAGHRWAEPLREAVPRLLQEDLAALRGRSRLWGAPTPAGVVVDRQLRVALLALEASADRRELRLRAHWSLADPAGRQPAEVGAAQLSVPVAGSGVDDLVAAHRLALWRLAQRIAGVAL